MSTVSANQLPNPATAISPSNNPGWSDTNALLRVKTQLSATCTSNCFYISPNGNDANPGTSAAPWKTWAYALKQLDPGDTLVAKNGTWTNGASCSGLPSPCLASTSLPSINCSSGYKNGTSSRRITVKAENERQAFLKSNGTTDTFRMQNCDYWTVEGLRGENADNSANANTSSGNVFAFNDSSNLIIRRLLAAKPNRYGNNHAITAIRCSNTLIEESEAYWFKRWGIGSFLSPNTTIRRCYANSRFYKRLSDGYKSTAQTGGDIGIGHYATDYAFQSGQIVENSISESNMTGFVTGAYNQGVNGIFGSIAIDNISAGIVDGDRGSRSTNGMIKDSIALTQHRHSYGFSVRSGTNVQLTNVTLFSNNRHGMNVDDIADTNGNNSEFRSTYIKNALVFNKGGNAFDVTGQDDWYIEYSNLNSNGSNLSVLGNISDASGYIRNSMSVAPTGMGLGANQCIVYVPPSSNMKGAGQNGSDIGANIIYRYENGVLTNQKLWNQSTGQFPCGATVTGVNDNATFPNDACVNVHKRLNVGVNGCPVP